MTRHKAAPWALLLLLLHHVSYRVLAARQLSAAVKACYFPAGDASTGRPCYPDQPNSVCCAPGFTCMSNGVCTKAANDKTLKYDYYRSGCTDYSFQDPACPHFCLGPEDHQEQGQGLQLCSAETGTYCCMRDYVQNCCSNSTLVFTIGVPSPVTVIQRPTKPAFLIGASPSASIDPASSLSLNSTSSTHSSQYARETIVGIALGISIAGIVALLAGGWWWIRRRRRLAAEATSTGAGKSEEVLPKGTSVTVSNLGTGDPASPIELDVLRREREGLAVPTEPPPGIDDPPGRPPGFNSLPVSPVDPPPAGNVAGWPGVEGPTVGLPVGRRRSG
ncbi:hypothetical protein EJ06DRAFT_560146 [Trichodelitschia bisporula]|uniref:Mid2 domain-containing protein n=1 Tax=Trichodelitschia bisporula TaxID=703511 RepID=A0A6G1HJX9_9PEZI|nr:hypothetical protein EJ06DRAFT_560146 [Trichodelitschia bisporula]